MNIKETIIEVSKKFHAKKLIFLMACRDDLCQIKKDKSSNVYKKTCPLSKACRIDIKIFALISKCY